MTEHDIRTAFGKPPASFRHQVDQTLMQLEDEPMKKRYKFTTVFALAALITVLLAGAAVAATQWKTFDFLQITPLTDADEIVQTNLGTVEDEYFRLDVEEAVFDGEGLIMQFRITPKQPDKYNLTVDYCSLTLNDDNPYAFCAIIADFYNSAIGLPDGLDHWTYEADGDSIIVYASHFGPPLDDTIQLKIHLLYALPNPNISLSLSTEITLTHTENIHHFSMNYEEGYEAYFGLDQQSFELLEGSFCYTDAFGYYDLKLLCDTDPCELMPYNKDNDSYFELYRHTDETLVMHRKSWSSQFLEEDGIWHYYEKGFMQPFVPYLGDGINHPASEGAILSLRNDELDIYESISVQITPID